MDVKELKDLVKAAKDKKVKDKDDYNKLTAAEKKAIRADLIAKATEVIDNNIKDAARRDEERYVIPKSDSLLSSMDDEAIAQLVASYNISKGNASMVCTDALGSLVIDWS